VESFVTFSSCGLGAYIVDNIRTILCDLPNRIGGFTVSAPDGNFTIVLNQNLSYEKNMLTYQHELSHIENGDFERGCSAGMLEIIAHKIM
jgi:hypothetical protein